MTKNIDYTGIKWKYAVRAFITFDDDVVVVYKKDRPFTQQKHTIIVKDLFVAQDVLSIVENKIKETKDKELKIKSQKDYDTYLELQR